MAQSLSGSRGKHGGVRSHAVCRRDNFGYINSVTHSEQSETNGISDLSV